MTFSFSQTILDANNVASLCWRGDELVDWVSGGRVYRLDGTREDARVSWGYRFDAAVALEDGQFAVIYERLGTKGVLLRAGEFVRELNRSFYHADAYEYPVCLWRGPRGRVLLAHCPHEYNRIEIEDAETGEVLTRSSARKPEDFFHSRLTVNPAGTRLLSAGWVWHPWSALALFDVGEALRDPRHLDRGEGPQGTVNVGLTEEASACWLSDDTIVVSGSDETEDPEEVAVMGDGKRLRSGGLAVFDVVKREFVLSTVPKHLPGTLMRADERHVITFHEHPRLVNLETGATVHEWPELPTGLQTSSILLGLKEPVPPLALDPDRRRFAVATKTGIAVVRF